MADEEKGTEFRKAATPSRAISPFEEMERFFDAFFPRALMRSRWGDWPSVGELGAPFEGRVPKVDVIDREAEVLVRAELPGVDRKDLDVTVSDDRVTIKATTKAEHKEESGDYVRSEIQQGSYSRTVALPAAVDGEAAKARFADGVLELSLPKVSKTERRRIPIE